MPNLNVGLGVAMWCGVALAANDTACVTCADCYRCTSYSGCNCTNCVYDADYCFVELPVCMAGYFYNQVTGQCEPTQIEVIPTDCEEGYYLDGMLCFECPALPSGTTILTESCRIQAVEGGTLFYPQTGAEQCAMTAYETIGLISDTQCEYSDDKGTFVFTADCFYSGSDSSGEESGSEESGSEESGSEESGSEEAGSEEVGSEEADAG